MEIGRGAAVNKMNMHELQQLLQRIFTEHSFISAVLSSPLQDKIIQKITVRPLLLKNQLQYQWTVYSNNQAQHSNLDPATCLQKLVDQSIHFKQTLLCTEEADYHILTSKHQRQTILRKKPTKAKPQLTHNRPKQHMIPADTTLPFLVELGIMLPNGKIAPQKGDKFKQINRFLEMVEDILSHFDAKQPLQVVDLGCGKAYLTFALYHYLSVVKGYALTLTGVDLKKDVIQTCQNLAQKLGYSHLHFAVGDINSYQTDQPVDMVVSLHACDTATDAALEKAVRWQARVILCAPCCQHELYTQVQNPSLDALLKHGILKERFAALATDAARAQILEALGYQTQLLEFIDPEHTPKNVLIRAVKREQVKDNKQAQQTYATFKQALHIHPSLEKRFEKELLH